MKTPLRMTVLVLVTGALVVACSGGATPVDPEASPAREVGGGPVPNETAHGVIGADNSSGGASLASAPAAKDPRMEAWRKVVANTPAPKEGCFTVTYPSTTWTEEPCAPAVSNPIPAPPRRQALGAAAGVPAVGGGTDWFAQTTTPTLSATGSFPAVSGVSTVSSVNGANAYSLQVNTNAFNSSECSGGLSGCKAAMQAVFYGQSGNADIWYVLLGYYSGSTIHCPSLLWQGVGGSCYLEESGYQVNIGAQPVSNLQALSLSAAAGSTNNTMTISAGGSTVKSIGVPNIIGLGSAWTNTEFNIFGDGSGDSANFAGTPTIQVQTEVQSASAPGCSSTAPNSTVETNNLSLIPNCCLASANAITFVESGAYPPTCTVCGTEGQKCCSTTASGSCVSPFDACYNGKCTACGGDGEPCCAGSTCSDSAATCAPATGICVTPLYPNCPVSYWTCTGTYGTETDAYFQCNTPPINWTLILQRQFSDGSWQQVGSVSVDPVTGQYSINEFGYQPTSTVTYYRVCLTNTLGQVDCDAPVAFNTPVPSCTCTPTTCAASGTHCGTVSDGCGGTLHCGTCTVGTCSAGQCVTGGGGGCKPGTCN